VKAQPSLQPLLTACAYLADVCGEYRFDLQTVDVCRRVHAATVASPVDEDRSVHAEIRGHSRRLTVHPPMSSRTDSVDKRRRTAVSAARDRSTDTGSDRASSSPCCGRVVSAAAALNDSLSATRDCRDDGRRSLDVRTTTTHADATPVDNCKRSVQVRVQTCRAPL